jgi:hypothetical protein
VNVFLVFRHALLSLECLVTAGPMAPVGHLICVRIHVIPELVYLNERAFTARPLAPVPQRLVVHCPVVIVTVFSRVGFAALVAPVFHGMDVHVSLHMFLFFTLKLAVIVRAFNPWYVGEGVGMFAELVFIQRLLQIKRFFASIECTLELMGI